MPWNEVLEVGPFVAFIQIFFAVLTIYHKSAFLGFDLMLIFLFLLGSYLNTFSEWKRMIWKKDAENKGKLYTKGLFKYSMHINYFGDSISFTAFALLTGSLWGITIPVAMTLGFIFIHIPKLDRYLSERYGDQFELYSKKTKKFIPWIY
jgi:steroid 5-alpha reductase family enzyme